ncbi:hypothetical protein BV898_09152 [Hypsibius exemplaris]|uniref:DUF1279 domain-containing protein n=1 Tax=Hypsibius exemplaris TaxID=2072580 RepID=A0A1W0WNJ9_HYPEX|nr:hypothetical protein BV898_09152 [Hypsibius exemplaris]
MTNWEKFKDMYKKYWYVLVPVHGILSAGFMVVLYYLVKSGVDVVPLLEKLGLPESVIGPVRKSGASAYVAAAYAIYHLIAPLRYAVTLAFTTLTITYLKRFGYIKPVPSSKEIKQLYDKGRAKVEVFSKRLSNRRKSSKPPPPPKSSSSASGGVAGKSER